MVTGAGRGLGREHALLLAREGARVVVNDLLDGEIDPAREVVDEISGFGGDAVADHHSVAAWDSAAQIIGTAVSSYGRLDGLVCNAGFLRDRMLVNMTEAEWDDIVKVHLYGTFHLLRHAAEHWRDRHKAGETVTAAAIVTTAASGLHSNVGQANYGAAKAAIALLALETSRELGRYGVRVNAISPLARTRLTSDPRATTPGDGFRDKDPAQVSPLVAWLLAEDCPVTGQVYAVHGREVHRYTGWTAAENAHADADWTVDSVAKAIQDWPTRYVPGYMPGLSD